MKKIKKLAACLLAGAISVFSIENMVAMSEKMRTLMSTYKPEYTSKIREYLTPENIQTQKEIVLSTHREEFQYIIPFFMKLQLQPSQNLKLYRNIAEEEDMSEIIILYNHDQPYSEQKYLRQPDRFWVLIEHILTNPSDNPESPLHLFLQRYSTFSGTSFIPMTVYNFTKDILSIRLFNLTDPYYFATAFLNTSNATTHLRYLRKNNFLVEQIQEAENSLDKAKTAEEEIATDISEQFWFNMAIYKVDQEKREKLYLPRKDPPISDYLQDMIAPSQETQFSEWAPISDYLQDMIAPTKGGIPDNLFSTQQKRIEKENLLLLTIQSNQEEEDPIESFEISKPGNLLTGLSLDLSNIKLTLPPISDYLQDLILPKEKDINEKEDSDEEN